MYSNRSRQWKRIFGVWCIGAALLAAGGMAAAQGEPRTMELRDGRLYVNGEWVFLKVAKPLRDFGNPADVDQLIRDLDTLQAKHYNAIAMNCYWHHLDKDGDGVIDVSLDPLNRLIDAIYARGMFPCLSVETYAVGGGTLPKGLWEKHPEIVAINAKGEKVQDTEYGFMSGVPSFFAPAYLEASRTYIENLVRGIHHEKILYYETTVEPQFIGNQSLDYSEHARRAYEAWLKDKGIAGPAFPDTLPAPEAFLHDPVWNQFRAESLAAWVNGDAAAYRAVAGDKTLVAVDYLETAGREMPNRNGDSLTFLRHLDGASIIQVNWHWHNGTRKPNQVAYDNVHQVMRETGRKWAVSEHMTLNGSDYRPKEVAAILRNTFAQGTRFGWEFVNVAPGTADPFSLYNDDWSPKPLIAEVDNHWDAWMKEVHAEK